VILRPMEDGRRARKAQSRACRPAGEPFALAGCPTPPPFGALQVVGAQAGRRRLVWVERLLLAAGTIFLTVYAVARIDGWRSSRAALREFDRAAAPTLQADPQAAPLPSRQETDPDFSLWSPERVRAFEASALTEDRASAVIEMDRPKIRVPVFEGTDDPVLDRGAGFIPGTARPGEGGNIAIAGHRDGFFRGLMYTQVGDAIRLRAAGQTQLYRVVGTEIIDPDNIDVLMDRDVPTLTLVTCYPFYYVGSAPQRFIVHATLESEVETQD
jgi:sortase A